MAWWAVAASASSTDSSPSPVGTTRAPGETSRPAAPPNSPRTSAKPRLPGMNTRWPTCLPDPGPAMLMRPTLYYGSGSYRSQSYVAPAALAAGLTEDLGLRRELVAVRQ